MEKLDLQLSLSIIFLPFSDTDYYLSIDKTNVLEWNPFCTNPHDSGVKKSPCRCIIKLLNSGTSDSEGLAYEIEEKEANIDSAKRP